MMQDHLPPAISAGIHSWLLEDEILLFSEPSGELFRLNPSAGLIWDGVEAGLDPKAIAKEVSDTFGIPLSRAAQDVDAMLRDWEGRALLGCDRATVTAAVEEADGGAVPDEIPRPESLVQDYLATRCYRMLETVIRVRFAGEDNSDIAESVFGHLRVADDAPEDLVLDVHQDAGGYFLFHNGEPRAWCATRQEVAPLLHGAAVSHAYQNADRMIALHAAAVSNGKDCIVFPAASGSGKTTLTAALIAMGFRYATDELVLVKHGSDAVQAIAAGLGVKPGSWPVLGAFHPEIDGLPAHRRPDDKVVRYLLPQASMLPEDPAQHYRLRALVFPAYREGSATRLDALSAADALCRLTDAGADIEGGLDLPRVRALVEWIRSIPRYALVYGDLREAGARIATLLPR